MTKRSQPLQGTFAFSCPLSSLSSSPWQFIVVAKRRLCDHENCESAWNQLAWWTLRERTEHGKYHSRSSSLIWIRNSSIISSPGYLRLNATERLEKDRDISARRRECRRQEVIKSHLPSRDTRYRCWNSCRDRIASIRHSSRDSRAKGQVYEIEGSLRDSFRSIWNCSGWRWDARARG